MTAVEDFFRELDATWGFGETNRRIRLRIIGSTALMLRTGYERGTKDSDVLETSDLSEPAKERLILLAGQDTVIAKSHRMYVDIVRSGVPFIAQQPSVHPMSGLNAELRHLEIEVLDVVDVVVSKLKRFHGDDRGDIDAMVERGLVPHDLLLALLWISVSCDARAEDLPKYVANLHRVERDYFGMEDVTDIELPAWIDDG